MRISTGSGFRREIRLESLFREVDASKGVWGLRAGLPGKCGCPVKWDFESLFPSACPMQFGGGSHAKKDILTADLKIKFNRVFCTFICNSGPLPGSVEIGEQAGLAGPAQRVWLKPWAGQPPLPHAPGSVLVDPGTAVGSGLIEMSSYYQQRCLWEEGTSKTP